NHAGRVKLHGNFGENVGNDRNSCEIHRTLPAEAALQKLRHREYVAAQVKRYKHPAEDQQYEAGQPLEMSDGESGRSAGAGKSDEVLRRDVRNEQRGSDKKPSDISSRQKVRLGRALLAGKIEPDSEPQQE